MKKYVFLTSTITGIGGSIIYTNNKRTYLLDQGWEVEVISGMKGDVMLTALESFRSCIFSDLSYSPSLFPEGKREEILEALSVAIKPHEAREIVIESHTITMSLWGELLAQKLGAKHFVFLLNETFDISEKKILDFYDYKHKEPLKKLPEYALGLVKYSCSNNRLHGHCINPFPAELSLS